MHNTYLFFAATVVTPTPFNFTYFVYFLSCYMWLTLLHSVNLCLHLVLLENCY